MYTNTVMDVGDQCGVRGRACLFSVQYWPEFTLPRSELNESWSFLLARLNLKIWGSCNKSMLCKLPNFLGKSTTEHKTNNSALAVKWQIGSANALPSHGPGNEETSRKWGNLRKPLGKPPDHCGRHLRCKLRIRARKCDGEKWNEPKPKETLNNLFSSLGSSVKDT